MKRKNKRLVAVVTVLLILIWVFQGMVAGAETSSSGKKELLKNAQEITLEKSKSDNPNKAVKFASEEQKVGEKEAALKKEGNGPKESKGNNLQQLKSAEMIPQEEIITHSEETLLVKFKPGTPAETIKSINKANNALEKDVISKINVHVLKIPNGKTLQEMMKIYERNPNIEFVELDYSVSTAFTPNDPYFADSQTSLIRTSAPDAWKLSKGSASIPIAVLDTGIAASHEDLTGKVLSGYNFVGSNNNTEDDNGHGTRVAGILGAATDNGKGIAGVTWLNPIIPVKVMDSNGSGSYSNIAKGIIYAADNGAKVINMSLGGASSSATLKDAVDYAYKKNVVLVAAAGNSNSAVLYPAAYPNVIAVAALGNYDVKASYSCFGPQISVTAPGNVMSTLRTGSYGTGSGTSFASPFVAGLAGLILSLDSNLTPIQVQELIEKGADDLGSPGWDEYYGWGRINMNTSLLSIAGKESIPEMPESTDTTPPIINLKGSSTISLYAGETYTDEGATAQDDHDGDITDKLVVYNPVDTSKAGKYIITYNVTDTAGNKGEEVIRTIIVEEVILEPSKETVEDPAQEQEPSPVAYTINGSVGDRKIGNTAYHEIHIDRAGDLEAVLSWSGRRTDLDFYLYGPDGKLVGASKNSTATNLTEVIRSTITTGGKYIFKVTAVSGKASYTINLKLN
jgi:thermitase